MNKQKLINEISDATDGANKKEIAAILSALAIIAKSEIAKGNPIEIPGLVHFKIVDRAARPGRNPQTGETIQIPAKRVVKAVVAKALNDAVAT